MQKDRIRVGVIHWDASLPPETYFGYYQTRTLSPQKYRTFTPYYAKVLGEEKITYGEREQADYDLELSYAKEAGIDYFAYVFYPDRGSREHISLTYGDCSHRVYELNRARRMHETSSLRDQLSIAAIVGAHPFTEEDVADLVRLLGAPYYETVEGRPLLYLFGGVREEIMERIAKRCAEQGIPRPWFVAMYNDAPEKDAPVEKADALSAYAVTAGGITRYGELAERALSLDRARLAAGRAVIPLFTVGWDPSPRIDIPSPWVTYPNIPYAAYATEEELLLAAEEMADFIEKEAGNAFLGHILTFAWNEFEEGGWICPTYREDLSVNEERVRTFRRISDGWKKRLSVNKM